MHVGLKENHTILGLHMVGNKMNVDSLGFLKNDEMIPSSGHMAPRMDTKLETGTMPDFKMKINMNYNCWICEGWTQVSFKFDPYCSNNPPKKELDEEDNVLIHFSFDEYKPDKMSMNKDGTFWIIRMVPPIDFNYYFTVNGVPKYQTDLEQEAIMDKINLSIPFANVPADIRKTKEIINTNYLSKLKCLPRPKRENLMIYEETSPHPDWGIKDSVFWGYMIDTTDLYRK